MCVPAPVNIHIHFCVFWFDRLDQGSWCIHSDLPLQCSVMVEYMMENGTMLPSSSQVSSVFYTKTGNLYTHQSFIYAASYSILSFNLSNGGCNLYRKPSDTEVG